MAAAVMHAAQLFLLLDGKLRLLSPQFSFGKSKSNSCCYPTTYSFASTLAKVELAALMAGNRINRHP